MTKTFALTSLLAIAGTVALAAQTSETTTTTNVRPDHMKTLAAFCP